MQESAPRPRLDLVVNLTGAVSAGTYAAGVLDFLIEALDAFQDARSRDEAPDHEVVLTGLSGASAGAQTALIFASSIAYRFKPVPDALSGGPAASDGRIVRSRNPFYHHWVETNDLRDYLTTRDDPVQSLLDSTNIDRVVRSVLDFGSGLVRTRRAWVADPLRLGVALTDLGGVPTPSAAGTGPCWRHAESMYFAIAGVGSAPAPPAGREELALALPESAADKRSAWYGTLGGACTASGAFPIVFKPRSLERPPAERHALPSQAGQAEAPTRRFWAVDGGVLDNDPQDIAVRLCTACGSRGNATLVLTVGSPPRAAEAPASAGLLDIPGALKALCRAVWNQARYRPDAPTPGAAQDGPLRFLLSPAKDPTGFAAGDGDEEALHGAGLGGFAGYLSKEFRDHDFMLGRRNARAALAARLTLPEGHPLFAAWTDAQRQHYRVFVPSTKSWGLPLIPLSKTLARDAGKDAPLPPSAAALSAYRAPLRRRLRHLLRGLLPPGVSVPVRTLCRLAAWPAAWWLTSLLLRKARQALATDAAGRRDPER